MASAAADSSFVEANAAAAAAAEARGRRPVWNVPSNGAAIEVVPVMGAADAWPALSESTKAASKSSSSDSLKSLNDGSAAAAAAAPPGPLISSPSAKHSNITVSAPNPNPIQKSMPPSRQKSMKRGGGSGSSSSSTSNGGVSPTLPPLVSPESSPRGSRAHGGSDQNRGYCGYRRGSNAGGPHQNHGSRYDQEPNHHRNAPLQHQQRGGFRSYPRPPFFGPTSPRPLVGNAMGFPDLPSPLYFVTPQPPPESLRGVPFFPHPIPHAMFLPAMDPQRAQLLKQIDYYFSSENLCKDVYLRQNMDDHGWVPISLIAGFNKVKELTNNLQYILDTLQFSTLVEVQGEKIRRRNDWMNWLIHHNVSIEGAMSNPNNMRGPIHSEVVLTRSASGNLNNQFELGDPSSNVNVQFTAFTESDRLRSSRSLSRSDTL